MRWRNIRILMRRCLMTKNTLNCLIARKNSKTTSVTCFNNLNRLQNKKESSTILGPRNRPKSNYWPRVTIMMQAVIVRSSKASVTCRVRSIWSKKLKIQKRSRFRHIRMMLWLCKNRLLMMTVTQTNQRLSLKTRLCCWSGWLRLIFQRKYLWKV